MTNNQLLTFITNEDLYAHTKTVLSTISEATENAEQRLHSNVIDPFSAIFSATNDGLTLKKWLQSEKNRKIQKTLQNTQQNC